MPAPVFEEGVGHDAGNDEEDYIPYDLDNSSGEEVRGVDDGEE
jgi:hypothetical protein